MATIALPSVVHAAAAAALLPELVAAAPAGEALRLDGSAVDRIGFAGVQLLMSASLSRPVEIVDASPSLVETLRLCGAADQFGVSA